MVTDLKKIRNRIRNRARKSVTERGPPWLGWLMERQRATSARLALAELVTNRRATDKAVLKRLTFGGYIGNKSVRLRVLKPARGKYGQNTAYQRFLICCGAGKVPPQRVSAAGDCERGLALEPARLLRFEYKRRSNQYGIRACAEKTGKTRRKVVATFTEPLPAGDCERGF